MKRAAIAAVLLVTAAAAGFAAYRHLEAAPTQAVIRPWAIHEACVAEAARQRADIRSELHRGLRRMQHQLRARLRVETRPNLRRIDLRTLRELARTGPTAPAEYGFIARCENGPHIPGFPVPS